MQNSSQCMCLGNIADKWKKLAIHMKFLCIFQSPICRITHKQDNPKEKHLWTKKHQCLHLRWSECDSSHICPQVQSVEFVMYKHPNKKHLLNSTVKSMLKLGHCHRLAVGSAFSSGFFGDPHVSLWCPLGEDVFLSQMQPFYTLHAITELHLFFSRTFNGLEYSMKTKAEFV